MLLGHKDKIFYGWVIVVVFFIAGISLYGIYFSFGVFFKSIESEFGLTRAATSMILSANLVLAGVCSFFAGRALDRYGPRIIIFLMGLFTGLSLLLTSQTNSLWQLFITYSLLLAMGTGPLFVVPTSTISRWFDKKRGLALGIAGAGAGLGIVIFAPFATYLIANLDWRMAYLVIGLIAWVTAIPLSRFLKNDPREIGALPDGAKPHSTYMGDDNPQPIDLSLSPVFRTRSFWLIVFIWLFFAASLFLVFTHLVPHAIDIGFSAAEGATILSLLGGSGIAGRILMGIASDRIGRKWAAIISTLLQAGALVGLIWAQDLWMLYLIASVFGFAYGGCSAAMGALISDTFELAKIGAIFGVLEISFGTGAAIGPVIGGLIFDASNSYSLAFLLGAVAMLVVTLLIASIRRETVSR